MWSRGPYMNSLLGNTSKVHQVVCPFLEFSNWCSGFIQNLMHTNEICHRTKFEILKTLYQGHLGKKSESHRSSIFAKMNNRSWNFHRSLKIHTKGPSDQTQCCGANRNFWLMSTVYVSKALKLINLLKNQINDHVTGMQGWLNNIGVITRNWKRDPNIFLSYNLM